jgi:DNA-binding NtrC family response regulator
VPPLRERPADIPALARHFLARFAAEEGKRIRLIAPEAMQLLAAFPWPGNIRQLENALFRAVVLADGDSAGIGEFPQIAAAASTHGGGEAILPHAEPATTDLLDMADAEPAGFATAMDHPPLLPSQAPLLADALPLLDASGEVRPLEEIEAELVRYAITHYRGQMSEVARRLRIGRSTLYRKLEALGLNSERADDDSEAVAAERQPRKFA